MSRALTTRWVVLEGRQFIVRLAAGEPVSVYERKRYGKGLASYLQGFYNAPYWHAAHHSAGHEGTLIARILKAAKERTSKMAKWKIWYDVGFGREEEEIEAESEDEASEAAYEAFAQACEAAHDWGCELAKDELSQGLDAAISEELAEGTPQIMKEEPQHD